MHTNAISEKRPGRSQSLGIASQDPRVIAAHNEKLKKMGVRNAYIDKDGSAVFTSNKGRNQLLKAYGAVDKDGGFGQHTGVSQNG